MTGCEKFFAGKATVFVGERPDADEAATRTIGMLVLAGLRVEEMLCLQHEHVAVYHQGTLYNTSDDIDHLIRYANEVRAGGATAADWQMISARRWACSWSRPAPTHGRLELQDQGHAASVLPPLVGRQFRLVTRGGLLAFGNWWLGSIDVDTFELASESGLAPPVGAAPEFGLPKAPPEYDHVIIEVWPTDADGARKDCVRGKPHTTMLMVPFGHDIALHFVENDGMGVVRNRMDENLRGVFG